ncbi:MAG: FkbM family methyltransferase [Beijerinckiaceae bacterium]|nr:FkbM family methyltransferase [Beijerinckiaceae bacterium]
MTVRYPAKANTLRFFRAAGLPAGTVIDVGVQEETAELRQAFPDLRHILFEPVAEFHPALHRNYAGMDYVLVPAALSDRDGTEYLHKYAIDGGKISHSTLVDERSGEAVKTVAAMRLDSFMKGRADPKPYLLKLDVDGLEIEILRGAEGIWDDIGCIIIEANRLNIAERLNFLLSKRFKLFDIVDHCYYHGVFIQVDLVFAAEALMDNPNLRPWETKKFDWNEWVPAAGFEAAVQRSALAGTWKSGLRSLKFWKRG